jgi:hypothetical protein
MAIRRSLAVVLGAGLGLASLSCETRTVATDAGPSEPSPNASILPAPLATGIETARPPSDAGPSDAGLGDAEAAPPPVPAREDEPLAADTELREASGVALSGVTLRGRFRWPDVTPPPRVPETSADALDRARAAATFEIDVTSAAAGRLRVAFVSPRFVLPAGSELRARSSSYGHALVWPDGGRYVVVQPGALRTLLNERRADVVPLTRAAGTPRGNSQAHGMASERITLTTPLGRLELEQAHATGAGAGATLWCRFLIELAGVHPESTACRPDLLPVRAEYFWTEGGRLLFEAIVIDRAPTLELTALKVPPEHAEHRIGEAPTPASALLAERAQLRSIRVRPGVVRPAKDAPKEGLLLVNSDDLLRYALIDAWPVARLEARGTGLLLDLIPGTYSLSVRSFLGDEVSAPVAVTVPGKVTTGEAPRPEP